MNDLGEFAEVALAIFVALTLLIWLLTYLERTISRPLTEKRTRHPTEKKSRAARQQLASQVNTLDPSIHRWKRSSSRVVRDEFQEAAVGIPEVDTDPLTLGAKPRNRAGLNLDGHPYALVLQTLLADHNPPHTRHWFHAGGRLEGKRSE